MIASVTRRQESLVVFVVCFLPSPPILSRFADASGAYQYTLATDLRISLSQIMAEEGTQPEVKAEDGPNAPINIKVRLAVAPRVTVSDALLPFISLEHIVLSAASV